MPTVVLQDMPGLVLNIDRSLHLYHSGMNG